MLRNTFPFQGQDASYIIDHNSKNHFILLHFCGDLSVNWVLLPILDACNVVDAMRNRKQLEDSRDALKYAVSRLQKEIELIEADIASLGMEVRLDDRFFWEVLAPNISGVSDGYTTAQMIRVLEIKGQNVRPGNFRTFISRYGQRGYLEASGSGRALQWKLTTASVEQLKSRKRAM